MADVKPAAPKLELTQEGQGRAVIRKIHNEKQRERDTSEPGGM